MAAGISRAKYICETFIEGSRDNTKNQLPNVVVKSAVGLVMEFGPVCQVLDYLAGKSF
jgi:hypothetical protein